MSKPEPTTDAAAPASPALYNEVRQFYNREAELLDDRELEAWLDLLTEDVEYEMPVRLIREKNADRSPFSDRSFNYHEDRGTLESRIERFASEFAWSDDPPVRTRHFVTNVRIDDHDGDELATKTNLLLYWSQRERDEAVVSGERHDVLRRVDGDLKLARREVRLDCNVLPMKNLSVFL